MSVPAGWYPDPDPEATPGRSRYWDGSTWSEHVRSEADAPSAYPTGGSYQPEAYPSDPGQHDPYGQTGYAQVPGGKATHAPGGQRLSGYGRRVGAYLLDGLITVVLTLLAAWSFVSELANVWGTFFEESLAAAEAGAAAPDPMLLTEQTSGPILAITVIGLVINVVYFCGFWRWRGATPGKIMLGLRIRPWELDGPLGWGLVLRRWVGMNLGALVSVVPILGSFGAIWPIVDLLWPAWDKRRQALHDKFANTVVIRTR